MRGRHPHRFARESGRAVTAAFAKRTAEDIAQAARTLYRNRGEALAYLANRIMKLERKQPESKRLPELRAAFREIENHRQKYE